MVEGVANEVVVDAGLEHSHGMQEGYVDTDVIMSESDVRPIEVNVLIDDAQVKTVVPSEIDQNMKAESTDKRVCVSEHPLVGDGAEDGTANMEKVTEDGNEELSELSNTSGLVHDEDDMGKRTEATGCKDVYPVATGSTVNISAEEKNADSENVRIDGRLTETFEKNSEIQVSTAENICSTVVNAGNHNEPSFESASVNNDNVHPVSSSAGNLVLDSVEQHIIGNAPVASFVLQQTEESDQQMQSNLENTNGFKFSGNDFSPLVSCQRQDADQQIGNVESVVEVCEQANETASFCAVDLGATASAQSAETSDDTEMIDMGEMNEKPLELVSEISPSQSEGDDDDDDDDADQIESVSLLQEKANEPENEGTAVYIEEGDTPTESPNDYENEGAVVYIEEEDTITENVILQQEQEHEQDEDEDEDEDDEGEGDDEDEGEGEEEDGDEELVTGVEKLLHREEKKSKRLASKVGPLEKDYRATYELSLETTDQFSVNDLVWGKVKSHPWWPGQIFDSSDSSEKAMKHYRKDCFLVAYFGDKSFAWNEASQLKPFRTHFSQEEKQSSSEAFQNAIDCALEEVSKRMELGLTCSCMPEETYETIKFQIVENAGIQTESSKRERGDVHPSPESFQPEKLVNYVRNLSQLPTCGANRLELTIAKAQLLSFYRLKGRQSLPEVQFFEGLLENDADTLLPKVNSLPSESEHADSVAADDVSRTVRSKGPKRKHNLKDIVYHRRKEKSFSEIMGESLYVYDDDYDSDEKVDILLSSPTVSKKRKASNFLDDEPMVPERTRTISLAKVSKNATPSPRQSFKIGDCIRRAACQLAGSSSTLKSTDDGNNEQARDEPDKALDTPEDAQNENMEISTEETSPDGLLSELYLTAQDPMRAHVFSKSVVSFFSEFQDAAVSTQRKTNEQSSTARGRSGRKRKSSLPLGVAPEAFEFDDRKDSYWEDMVYENNSERKQPARRSRKRKDPQLGTGDPGKPKKSGRDPEKPKKSARDPERPKKSAQKRSLKKQKVNGDHHELTGEHLFADEVKPDLPTELILNFGGSSVPSVADLNRMFRRFGPLKESGTEVDKQNSCARLVFKNGSDAEIAYSSAVTFNIFGSITVNYQLNQTPVPCHSLAPTSAHSTEDAA